ncbi:MAG: glutaredoxin, partial [Deltaproteobacteria bacterium]|nr:glutaredoxin [Deltaproteobacteria bacterium]
MEEEVTDSNRIVVYYSPTCPDCRQALEYFEALG